MSVSTFEEIDLEIEFCQKPVSKCISRFNISDTVNLYSY